MTCIVMHADESDMADKSDRVDVLASASSVCSLDRGTGNGCFEVTRYTAS
jgi:hypothetical protein